MRIAMSQTRKMLAESNLRSMHIARSCKCCGGAMATC